MTKIEAGRARNACATAVCQTTVCCKDQGSQCESDRRSHCQLQNVNRKVNFNRLNSQEELILYMYHTSSKGLRSLPQKRCVEPRQDDILVARRRLGTQGPDDGRLLARRPQEAEHLRCVLGAHNEHHADAEVERARALVRCNARPRRREPPAKAHERGSRAPPPPPTQRRVHAAAREEEAGKART